MNIIIGLILIYCGIKLGINSFNDLRKIKYVQKFDVVVPENVEWNVSNDTVNKLIYMDIPHVSQSQQLEYFVARLRNLNFPEGMIVRYNGEEKIV